MDEQITGRLEQWYTEIVGCKMILWGCLYDDIRKRWEDGKYLHTSVMEIKEVGEGVIVHTANSVYLLGKQSRYKL